MITFNYGSRYFWDKVVLTKFINGVPHLICGASWVYKSKTEKVTGGRKSVFLPNWCYLLFITVLSRGHPNSWDPYSFLSSNVTITKPLHTKMCRRILWMAPTWESKCLILSIVGSETVCILLRNSNIIQKLKLYCTIPRNCLFGSLKVRDKLGLSL